MHNGMDIKLNIDNKFIMGFNDSLFGLQKSIEKCMQLNSTVDFTVLQQSVLNYGSMNFKMNEISNSFKEVIGQIADTSIFDNKIKSNLLNGLSTMVNPRFNGLNSSYMLTIMSTFKMQQDIIKPLTDFSRVLNSTLNNIQLPRNEALDLIFQTIISTNFQEYGTETIDEAKTIIRETINEALITDTDVNWQQSLKSKTDKFSKKNPVYAILMEKIVWLLFATLIFNPLIAYSKSNYNNAFDKTKVNTAYTIKDAKNEVKSDFNGYDSQTKAMVSTFFRYIKQDNVPIRISKSMDSSVVGTLNEGDVVEIINKERNWMHIQFEDEDEKIYTGWINTIYTGRVFNSNYR